MDSDEIASENVPRRGRKAMTRGAFLRSVATIVGAGTGVAALSGSADAKAPRYTTCCHTSAAPCPGCPGTNLNYKCYSDCFTGYSCICRSNNGNCYTFQCA